MAQLIYNTFDSGLAACHVELLRNYLGVIGGLVANVTVVPQEETQPQQLPLVVVSATEQNEAVFQTGIYEVTVEFSVRVDMDAGGADQLRTLSSAVLDYLQQTDLKTQLTAVRDPENNALATVKLLVLGSARLEEIGDRQWGRVFIQKAFGYTPARS